MTELQKNFIEKNMDLCSESIDEQISTNESITPGITSMLSSSDQQTLPTSPNTPFKFEPMIIEDTYSTIQACLGTNDIDLSQTTTKQILTCIFCQENSEVKLNSEALVLSAYVQKFVL